MARVRGKLSHPACGQRVYDNHHELANKIQQFGAVFRGSQPADDHCMCCGLTPPTGQLHEIQVQTQPDQEYYQIGIGRCEQILTSALVVRRLASSNQVVQTQMRQYEQQLGSTPRDDELKRMGGMLLPRLSQADQTLLRQQLKQSCGVNI